jgi:galactose oxidase-like protein/Kelch motif protein
MTRPTDQLFDQRIADWLEDDPMQAPGQVLEIVLAALPSISRRRTYRVPRRFIATRSSIRWPIAAATAVVLVLGGALYLNRPSQPAIGGPSPTPGASHGASESASPTAAPTSIVVQLRPATWTATGSMISARAGGTATLLPDGRVLVAGGIARISNNGGFRSIGTAELFDPGTGSWTATGTMPTPRSGHTATLLPDGTVLVTGGGIGSGYSLSADLYDPSTGSWTVTGAMSTGRSGSTATLLPDGKVLVAGGDVSGGWGGYTSSAELYDPSTGTWTTTGNMTTPRGRHTATLLPNGTVLVVGGGIGEASVASAELYDPGTGVWTPAGSMGVGRGGHAATLLLDGKVLVAGGQGSADDRSAELYDPGTGSWTTTGSMIAPRGSLAATVLGNGHVLVVGPGDNDPVLTAELYDPGTGSWVATPSLGVKRDVQSVTLLADGMVLVVSCRPLTLPAGGNIAFVATTSYGDLYDPGTGQ